MHQLAGLIAILIFLSGCASKPAPSRLDSATTAFADLRLEIRAEISDADRQRKLIELVDELESIMASAVADQRTTDQQIRELNRDFYATQEDFAAIFDTLNETKKQRRQRLVEISASARALTTDREWKRLNRVRMSSLGSALEAASQTGDLP